MKIEYYEVEVEYEGIIKPRVVNATITKVSKRYLFGVGFSTKSKVIETFGRDGQQSLDMVDVYIESLKKYYNKVYITKKGLR